MTPPPTEAPHRPGPRGRSQRPHDAAATRELIADAAVRLLAERGFPGLGVNRLAAAAGVDKQLIYYHFGGLEGVVRHLGTRLQGWLGAPLQPRDGEPYADAVQRLLLAYARALRGNAMVLRLLAWELVEPSDALDALEGARSAAMLGWAQAQRSAARPAPAGVDAPAVNALLLAALHHLALREQASGHFAGLDLGTAEGAARVDAALQLIVRRVYGALR